MNKTYKMTIAGLERDLPLCPINEHLSIGAFVIFGDVELTVASAEALLKKLPEKLRRNLPGRQPGKPQGKKRRNNRENSRFHE
jgi:hypothetical protein